MPNPRKINYQKDGYFFYKVQRLLDIEENVAVSSNQKLKTEFGLGDTIRTDRKLPAWLTTSRLGLPAYLKLLENGSGVSIDKAYDVELPIHLLRAKYTKT